MILHLTQNLLAHSHTEMEKNYKLMTKIQQAFLFNYQINISNRQTNRQTDTQIERQTD